MTATEWLVSELMSKGIIDADKWVWNDDISILDITNQAKEMEFHQMKKSYYTGCASELFDCFEKYYNETYGTNK